MKKTLSLLLFSLLLAGALTLPAFAETPVAEKTSCLPQEVCAPPAERAASTL